MEQHQEGKKKTGEGEIIISMEQDQVVLVNIVRRIMKAFSNTIRQKLVNTISILIY